MRPLLMRMVFDGDKVNDAAARNRIHCYVLPCENKGLRSGVMINRLEQLDLLYSCLGTAYGKIRYQIF